LNAVFNIQDNVGRIQPLPQEEDRVRARALCGQRAGPRTRALQGDRSRASPRARSHSCLYETGGTRRLWWR